MLLTFMMRTLATLYLMIVEVMTWILVMDGHYLKFDAVVFDYLAFDGGGSYDLIVLNMMTPRVTMMVNLVIEAWILMMEAWVMVILVMIQFLS
jgi:hypothetical protein